VLGADGVDPADPDPLVHQVDEIGPERLPLLARQRQPRPLRIDGLAAFAYRDGLWEPLSRHMFRR